MRDDYTQISIVLDRSGSMASIADDTVGGLTSFINEQKHVPGYATLSLMQFDDKFDSIFEFKDISSIDFANDYKFIPRGMTALYDAIGKSIIKTGDKLSSLDEDSRPAKVIFVIVTDGAENSSREYSHSRIQELIKQQTDIYSWEFVFLGANIDADVVGTSLGIKAGNTIKYAANTDGVVDAYASINANLTSFRCMSSDIDRKTYSFFNESDRENQKIAGA